MDISLPSSISSKVAPMALEELKEVEAYRQKGGEEGM